MPLFLRNENSTDVVYQSNGWILIEYISFALKDGKAPEKSPQKSWIFAISSKMLWIFWFLFRSKFAQCTCCAGIFAHLVYGNCEQPVFGLWGQYILGLYEFSLSGISINSGCNFIYNISQCENESLWNFRLFWGCFSKE